MSDQLEQVAEAIWRATFPDSDPGHYDWAYGPEDGQWGRDTFRRMAEAAVAALSLPREWGVGLVLDIGGIDANADVFDNQKDAQKKMRDLNAIFPDDRRHLIARFGRSPWVVVS